MIDDIEQMDGQLSSVPGIYVIRHEATRTVYIGQSNDIRRRWAEHKAALARNQHPNSGLQNAWISSGGRGFVVELYSECPRNLSPLQRQRWLVKTERKAIESFRAKGAVVNLAEPEIVATLPAIQESQEEQKLNDRALTRRRKTISTQIEDLQKEAVPDQTRRAVLLQEVGQRAAILRRSTGWRRLLFGLPTDIPVNVQREELQHRLVEIGVIDQRLSPVQARIRTLQQQYSQLYLEFSKVRGRNYRLMQARTGINVREPKIYEE